MHRNKDPAQPKINQSINFKKKIAEPLHFLKALLLKGYAGYACNTLASGQSVTRNKTRRLCEVTSKDTEFSWIQEAKTESRGKAKVNYTAGLEDAN